MLKLFFFYHVPSFIISRFVSHYNNPAWGNHYLLENIKLAKMTWQRQRQRQRQLTLTDLTLSPTICSMISKHDDGDGDGGDVGGGGVGQLNELHAWPKANWLDLCDFCCWCLGPFADLFSVCPSVRFYFRPQRKVFLKVSKVLLRIYHNRNRVRLSFRWGGGKATNHHNYDCNIINGIKLPYKEWNKVDGNGKIAGPVADEKIDCWFSCFIRVEGKKVVLLLYSMN